jgi:hypothetical protein
MEQKSSIFYNKTNSNLHYLVKTQVQPT